MPKTKIWLGLSAVGVLLSGVLLGGQQLVNEREGLIRSVLDQDSGVSDTTSFDNVEGSAYKDANGKLSDAGFERMIADSYKYCEESVEQGSVMLKNAVKNGTATLPLKKTERKISLLGQGSKNLFMRSGAGGAAPNTELGLVVNLDQAFENNGFTINHKIFDKYSTLSNSQMTTPSTQVEHSFSGFYTSDMTDSLSEYNDAAVITFVRIGTENTDPGNGQLNLKEDEKKLLQYVKDSGAFEKIIVLINSPMPMSMDWIDVEEYGIDAAVWMGVPGYYGAGGIVHVLMGEDAEGKLVNPSGHCPDTFAANASSSAAYANFGDRNCVVYKEGVYVGYKYYETRYADAILGQGNADGSAGTFNSQNKSSWNYADEMGYPFGYGMSFTTFEQKIRDVKYNEETDSYDFTVEVKNTGDVDGKSSIQIYAAEPYTQFDKENGLGKSAISFMTYDKVDVKAGETVQKKLSVERYFLCTYDHVVNKSYILEGGDYYFALGNGAHEAINNVLAVQGASGLYDHLGEAYEISDARANELVKKVEITQDLQTYKTSHYDEDVEVTNQFDDADYNFYAKKNNKAEIVYLDRQDWQGTWPTKTTTNPTTDADTNMAQYYKKAEDAPKYDEGDGVDYNVPYINDDGQVETITFAEMSKIPLEGTVTEGKYAGKDGAEMWDAFIKQMNLNDLAISISDNRGILDVLKVLKKGNFVQEGPEGLLRRFQYGDKRWATGFPTGPTFTATFDPAMQGKFGAFFGEEALFSGVACVNAPGANINRTPYGSRASEYMSEDGILNYNVASRVISEARRKGLIMNIKHCFLNNQETGRQGVSTWCNEQAIREIYLKPFEGALTKGRGLGIMTSYNRIGCRYAATHEPLMLNVMRGEWAYKGLIIDDALTGSNTSNYSNGPAMIYCGTDLFCLDGGRGAQLASWVRENNDGTILRCMQRANKYIMYAMSRSWMGGITVTADEIIASSNPWWKTTVNAVAYSTYGLTGALIVAYVFFEVMGLVRKSTKEEN